MATGSEVHLALDTGKKLAAASIKISVIPLPSWGLVCAQRVLPPEEPGEGHRNAAIAGREEERNRKPTSKVFVGIGG